MLDQKPMTAEERIERYSNKLKQLHGKSGYKSEFMLNLYTGMLESAREEIKLRSDRN